MSDAALIYPPNLMDMEKNPAVIQFQFFEREDIQSSFPKGAVQLYMPQSVSQPSTVSWDTEKFGFIGNQISKGIRNGVTGDAASEAAGQAWELTKQRAGYNLGSKAAQLMGGNVSAEALMGDASGKVPNPYLTMVFRGVDFRTFTFSFKFAPFSEDDCYVIQEIIKTFRRNALPPGKAGEPFLGYPRECEITYQWKGEENQFLHKFKRAVCTGVDVDYTGQGMFAVMRNGMPANIVLNTKWSEIELVLRDDVTEGY